MRANPPRLVRPLCCVLSVSLLLGGCAGSSDAILPTVTAQLRAHPGMQVEDVYKLVHQAAFGNGHLMTDAASDRAYLLTELASVTADASEPMIEPLSPDGSVIRVNLRPFKARDGDPQQLLDAMAASAQRFRPQPDLFERWWQEIVDGAGRGAIPLDPAALREFAAARKADGYPAIHHSAAYEARYHPAYRVVLRELVPALAGR